MRAIDADALMKRVQQEEIQAQVHGREFSTCFYNGGGTASTEWWYVEDLIENAPTITSAQPEIIYCKDCKHHHRDNSGAYYCGRKEYGYGWGLNDFCSDAERRTDEPDKQTD